MARKNAIRVMFVASGVLVGIVLVIGVVFASTSSSSDAIARTAAVEKGFKTDELYVRNLKITECLGGLLGEEAYVELAVKDSEPLQTVRIEVSRYAFQPSWKVHSTSVPPVGR